MGALQETDLQKPLPYTDSQQGNGLDSASGQTRRRYTYARCENSLSAGLAAPSLECHRERLQHIPYFEYFAEDMLPFFEKKEVFLLDLNEKIRETVMSLMQIKTEVRKTNSYVENPENTTDYRSSFNPKLASNTGKPYYQVFDHKFGFVADLSILDLFNEGTEGILYLTE